MTKLELLAAVALRMPALQLHAADVYILALASRGELTSHKTSQDLGLHTRTADRHIRTLLTRGYIGETTHKRPAIYALAEKGEELLRELFAENPITVERC